MRTIKSMITRLCATVLIFGSMSSFANPINLYAAPNDKSRVTGTIDLSKGLIPIYQPEGGKWMKVGNPNNGATGWVHEKDLKDSKGNKVSFQQRFYQSENKGNSSQMMQQMFEQYSKELMPNDPSISKEEALRRQKAAEQSMQQMQKTMGIIMREMQNAIDQSHDALEKAGMPSIREEFQKKTKPQAVPRQQPQR